MQNGQPLQVVCNAGEHGLDKSEVLSLREAPCPGQGSRLDLATLRNQYFLSLCP